MKPLSKTLTEENIAFSFPLRIEDDNGNETYHETSSGFWCKREHDSEGNQTYHEDSNGYWNKSEYDSEGNETYYENSDGFRLRCEYDSEGNQTYYEDSYGHKTGAPTAKHSGKVVTVDGVEYKLEEINQY